MATIDATRRREHTTATIVLARTMYAGGEGWTFTEICRYLAERDIIVTRTTVRRWVDPEYAEHRREMNRQWRRRKSERSALDVMRGLHADGMSCPAIAIVMRRYHGLSLNRWQVEYALKQGIEPRPTRTGNTTKGNAC